MSDYTDGFEAGARWASLHHRNRGGVVTAAPLTDDIPDPPDGTPEWRRGWVDGAKR